MSNQGGESSPGGLKLLRQAGLIDCERRGTWVYYWLLPEATAKLATLFARPVAEWPMEAAAVSS